MKRVRLLGLGLVVATLFSGCGGSSSANADTTDTTVQVSTSTTTFDSTNDTYKVTLASSYQPDAGRLLASGCFQCHGTNGVSTNDWDSIAGEDELHEEMFEDDEPIMLAQAKGYTNEEITLIENYLKNLKGSDEEEEHEDDEDDDEDEYKNDEDDDDDYKSENDDDDDDDDDEDDDD